MGTMTSAQTAVAKSLDQDRSVTYAAYVLLLLVIILSTYLHHYRPEILSVPDNMNVSAWQSPTFEQTTISDRVTVTERQKILTEGIPNGNNLIAMAIGDLFVIILGWWCFRHARKHYGFWMASCFFIGSFVFTGLEENSWILIGRYFGGTVSLPPGALSTERTGSPEGCSGSSSAPSQRASGGSFWPTAACGLQAGFSRRWAFCSGQPWVDSSPWG